MPEVPSEPSTTALETSYEGIPGSSGLALAPVIKVYADEHIIRKRRIRPDEVEIEISRLEVALLQTRQNLQKIRQRLVENAGEKDAGIIDAHILILEDSTLIEAVKSYVQGRLLNVDFAYDQEVRHYVRKMRELDDDYFRERAADIQDVARRVLLALQGKLQDNLHQLDSPCIILAHDLSPADAAGLDKKLILGIALEAGSRVSHAAIMARALGIPAVVGLRQIMAEVEAGVEVMVDGQEGVFIVAPSELTKAKFQQRQLKQSQIEESLDQLRETLPITQDQRRIIVSANVEELGDLPGIREHGAEGIGLLRTEYLFLQQDVFPTEMEQAAVYAEMARASLPHSLIIRTLDIGGDKKRPHLGIDLEVNPFLGYRGIRYCLGKPDLFRTQLRAICRASAVGNVRVMFPMVSDLNEIKQARQLLAETQVELRQEGVPIDEKMACGVMIEVPSAALMADVLARHVDFFSVGSNDLIQYTMAIDRGNENVAGLYQPAHPAILRLLQMVVEAAHRQNIWVGVCGEMASDVIILPALIGLGVDELSASALHIPRIKRAIQAINYEETRHLAARLVQQENVEENIRELDQLARRLYPEIL